MLFVVKRWQSGGGPVAGELLRLLDLPDDGQKLLAGGPISTTVSPTGFYGCMGVLAALFMWKFVPETKGKTLEELEALWEPETKKTQQTATL